MAETSTVQAVVKVGSQYYSASKMVEVSLGGCG
jgi:predicted secreted protein